MNIINQNKIVIFGAGKIGRSFIGQLFSRGDYEVVFIDVFKQIIEELNKRRNYNVIIRSDKEETINITNVRGVFAGNIQEVTNEVATSRLVAVCVGSQGLNGIFPLLANGLSQRYASDKSAALDIIIAENMHNADEFFRKELKKLLPADYPFEQLVGLVETSIGKMVPIMQKKDMEEDMLQVFAEPFNTLILDKKAFKNKIPSIEGLSPKENIKAWVDRKLYIHNLGHATAAYVGYVYKPTYIYLYEVLAVPHVFNIVKDTMHQSADILIAKYPEEFSKESLNDHINDLLMRFKNKALGDTIYRIGCDLKRKLGPDDRFAGIIKLALAYNLPFDKILYGLICGCHFRAKDENNQMLKSDIDFINRYYSDVDMVLSEISGFDHIRAKKVYAEAREIPLYK